MSEATKSEFEKEIEGFFEEMGGGDTSLVISEEDFKKLLKIHGGICSRVYMKGYREGFRAFEKLETWKTLRKL